MAANPIDPGAPDAYQLLNVPPTASTPEILRAYRVAIKRAHPDRQRPERRAAAEELTKQLNLAYAKLADPADRLAYDRTIRAQHVQDQIMSRYASAYDPFDLSAASLRRAPSPASRRELVRADRSALLSLVAIFGTITLLIISLLLLRALLAVLLRLIF